MRYTLILIGVFILTSGMGSRPADNIDLASEGRKGARAPASSGLPSTFNCQSSNDKMRCLVCNCFHESRGESHAGQVAVSRTVLSRVMSQQYPNSVCGVIYQKSQFSWTAAGSKRNMVLGSGSRNEPGAYQTCVNSVNEALKYENQWFGSHFHTVSTRPSWRSTCKGKNQIGNHIFYSSCGSVVPPKSSGGRSKTISLESVIQGGQNG